MEYVIIDYLRSRKVYVGEEVIGQTKEMLILEPGQYEVHLGEPLDYEPMQQVVDVQSTSASNPIVVRFYPKTS